MAEEQELPEDGKLSIEHLRALGILDEYLPCTEDVLECLKGFRSPSTILRTKEVVKQIAKKMNMKGKINMYGVEVDCD